MTDEVLAALKQALDKDPHNGPLWLHYADLLVAAQRDADALTALRSASELEASREAALQRLVPLLRRTGQLAEALIRVEALLARADDPKLRLELARIHEARGEREQAEAEYARAGVVRQDAERAAPSAPAADERRPALAGPDEQRTSPEDWAAQFDWGDLRVTLEDVAGLEEVKREINLRIIAPFKQPEIYRAFGRDAGGGILLYGPPGCGKTYIARATAGELSARFVSVSIHDVVDKYWGESEKLVHALFADARKNSPTVLFFDEFDALGSSRGQSQSAFWKTLVDQLLQEMDGIGARNRDLLVFAATNMPWNVDSAFRRPGRFDRVVFVPPPDAAARAQILERHLSRLPGVQGLPVKKLVAATELFTGADLKALCERAGEGALSRSLETGRVHEVQRADVDRALAECTSTALEWLSTARNYARYSNEGGQYDALVRYLKQVKRW